MNKLFNASDDLDTLVDLEMVQMARRDEFPTVSGVPIVAEEGRYCIYIYLTGRSYVIKLNYPYTKKGKVAWNEDYMSFKLRNNPL